MVPKRLRTFGLRTMLLVIALIAVGLSVWQQVQQCQRVAHEHHYFSLQAGYRATAIQGSNFDRTKMESAYPHWEQSIQHSQLADHYLRVTTRPWIMFLPQPTVASLPQLPREDAVLPVWWQNNVANHVAYNGLDCNWGSYHDGAVSNRNLALLNIRPASFNRFLALSHPELVDAP